MRIALVDPGSFVLPYVSEFARALVGEGHEVAIYCSETKYNFDFLEALQEHFPDSVEVISFKISRSRSPSIFSSLFEYIRLGTSLIKRRKEFDIVLHQFSIFLPVELALWISLRDVICLLVHNASPHHARGKFDFSTYILSKYAKRVVFCSESELGNFKELYPSLGHKKYELIQHGILPALPLALPPSTGVAQRDLIPTFIGTVRPYKRIEKLVSLYEEGCLDRLQIYGKWDRELYPTKARAQSLGVVVKDAFLPGEELDRILREDRVFLLPYHDASQSGVLYLLLFYLRPFIASARGDLAEFLRGNDLEELIIDESWSGVGDKLDYIQVNSPEITRKLELARQRYSWDQIISGSELFSGSLGLLEN